MADGETTRHRHAVNDATEMSQGMAHDQASEKPQSEPVSRMAPARNPGSRIHTHDSKKFPHNPRRQQ
jgi:hypothetical protein